jgi:predicted DNA-binding protein (UPF0251 family)/predicted Fe-Mo cluster-binding NifX family protein
MFKPVGIPGRTLDTVRLTFDGLEALRLLDLEGLSQEEAAGRLGVSRSTVSRLAAEARRVVAEALVGEKGLVIEGGPVAVARRLTDGEGSAKEAAVKEVLTKGDSVIIAVPYADGRVNAHFGRTESFMVVEAEGREVVESTVYAIVGLQHDHGGLSEFLLSRGVDVILAGGMGPPMQQALKDAGFSLYCGVSGPAEEAVLAYLAGELEQSDAVCGHHGAHEHHGGHHHGGEHHHGDHGNHAGGCAH